MSYSVIITHGNGENSASTYATKALAARKANMIRERVPTATVTVQPAFGIFYVSAGQWVQHGSAYVNRDNAAEEAAIFNALTGRGAVVMEGK